MSATIKLKLRDKERLDQLRARLLLRGQKLNQEELLSQLIDLGERNLLYLDSQPMKKLSAKRKDEILSRAIDISFSAEATIDYDIYEG